MSLRTVSLRRRVTLSVIGVLGVGAQWIAWRLHLPGILMLLVFGIILGQFISPDAVIASVTGGDESAGPRVLFPLVSLSVAVILFEGSLTLRLGELREAGSAVLRLVTIGAIITCVMTTLAAHWSCAMASASSSDSAQLRWTCSASRPRPPAPR